MLHQLMLFTPQRGEIPGESIANLFQEEHNGERKVAIVSRQVMPFLESVEEARYMIQELEKELDLDLTETAANLDPQAEQDNEDCIEAGEEEHPEFVHLDPSQFEFSPDNQSTKKPTPYCRIDVSTNHDLYRSTASLDRFQMECLNIAIKYAHDIVKARKLGNPPPRAPLLIAQGGAGSGKSTVINIIAQWFQKIVAQEGDDLDCPHLQKTAYTGTAASNIGGPTLHSMFNFSFDNQSGMSSKKLDQKRAELKNLKLLIIDEISMVKSDMLYDLDQRLQKITQKYHVPFGGVGIMAFGDMMQLKPVRGRWIFEQPASPTQSLLDKAGASLWSQFESIDLEINHRQGEDREYAELLNRVRVGEQTPEDLALLKTRVRPAGHPDLEEAVLYIGCKKKFVSEENENYINKHPGQMITLKAVNIHPNKKGLFKPKLDPDSGTIGQTAFKDVLKVKKDVKIILIHNLDTSDCLTNGQLGKLVDVIETKDGTVDKLVVKFRDERVGLKSQQKNPAMAAKFPGCVILERVQMKYSLSKSKTGATATLYQFPIWLSHSITCHKIQGQSIKAPQVVVVDINSCFRMGGPLAYVAISRVQNMNQLFIKDSLDPKKIICDEKGKKETKRLRAQSWNENPSPWMKQESSSVKIASLNCARLQPHIQFMRNDDRLLRADVIHLQETWLKPRNNTDVSIQNYQEHFVSVGDGKGIASYYKDPSAVVEYKDDKFQVSKLTTKEVTTINVYRSAAGNKERLVEVLKDLVDDHQATLISGDFNICNLDKPNNSIKKALEEMEFHLLVDVATHIQGGHIDHVYWRDPTGTWATPIVERYSPFYSDHDALLLTMKRQDQEK